MAIDEIQRRADKARQRYGEYASIHEIHGVIVEEFHELTDALHRSDWASYRYELADIAAVCIRAINETTTREKLKQI